MERHEHGVHVARVEGVVQASQHLLVGAHAASVRVRAMSRRTAAAGSALFLVLAPGVVAGLVPWLLTGWESNEIWLPLRVLGAL